MGNKFLRKIVLGFACCICAIPAFAQSNLGSPYSRFGIGQLRFTQDPHLISLGGLSQALTGTGFVTPLNPASYMNIDSLAMVFQFSLAITTLNMEQKVLDETKYARATAASLGNLSFSFQATRWWKMSLGLTPVSGVGYQVSTLINTDSTNIGSYRRYYDGDGGFNKVYWGHAFGIGNLSVGANINYTFGQITKYDELVFEDTTLLYPSDAHYQQTTKARGLGFDFGLQYTQALNKNYDLVFGASYGLRNDLNAKQQTTAYGQQRPNEQGWIDTAFVTDEVSGTLQLPSSFAVGLTLKKNRQWFVGADFGYYKYSEFRSFGKADPMLTDAWSVSIGGERLPQLRSESFFGRMAYRAGVHFGKDYVNYHDNDLREMGLGVGVGIPIKRSKSMINVSYDYSQRGNINEGQIGEHYSRITIGLTAIDSWFIRGKFD